MILDSNNMKINFGGVHENITTREEFPLSKAREVLKDETERERRERAKQKKEDKRRLEKEKFDKEILEEINRAERLTI